MSVMEHLGALETAEGTMVVLSLASHWPVRADGFAVLVVVAAVVVAAEGNTFVGLASLEAVECMCALSERGVAGAWKGESGREESRDGEQCQGLHGC